VVSQAMSQEKPIQNFCLNLDEATLKQFDDCAKQDYVVAAALMPDAHNGYVAPIGSVLITKGKVVPAWVGYDIGCGVTAVKLTAKGIRNLAQTRAQEIYDAVSQKVPMGLGKLHGQQDVHVEQREKFKQMLAKLRESPHDEEIFDYIRRKSPSNIGTLGEGNHFIELSFATDEYASRDAQASKDEIWVVIHSGSRNIGHKVAMKYMKKSAKSDTGFEETFPLDVDSDIGREYLAILEFGLAFALLNRYEMAVSVAECIEQVLQTAVDFELWTNKNHNHAIPIEYKGETCYVHRKGATPAKLGERGVIPGNMRDGCFLVEGLGNPDFLWSSSHGAGRIMGRKQAKELISMDEFAKTMDGIVGTVSKGTLDEAPMAYKNVFDVMDMQKDSVKIMAHLKPFINWKGDEKSKLGKKVR
jgi:tRNA-splicing ligase RtcB